MLFKIVGNKPHRLLSGNFLAALPSFDYNGLGVMQNSLVGRFYAWGF